MRITFRSSIFIVLISLVSLAAGCGGGGGDVTPNPPPPPSSGVPAAPEALAAVAVSGSEVDLSWKASTGATSYTVYRGTTSGSYSVLSSGNSAALYSDTTVTTGQTYYYVVSATSSYGEGDKSGEVSATPAAPGGTLVIQGTVKYEDKEYNSTQGLTGNTSFKAVRFAQVDLVNSGGTTLMTTRTTSAGLYSISTSTNTGANVYVRVYASSNPVGSQTLNVKNLSAVLYAFASGSFILNGNTNLNVNISTANTVDGPFNILDVYNSGFQFVYSQSSTTETTGLNAYWAPNNIYGTYYCPPGEPSCPEGIYILNDPNNITGDGADTDEFDDDVLWHEFGHFTLQHFSQDDSPGGLHYLDDNTEDLRLSWSEGWGNFFETAVKYWLYNTDPGLLSQPISGPNQVPLSQYIDTQPGGIYISLNISNPDTLLYSCGNGICYFDLGDKCYYASSEIAVARTLWALMDESVLGFGMAPIWNSITTYMIPTNSNVPYAKLEDFWDGWLISNGTSNLSTLGFIFNQRLINYTVDAFGASDNTIATASTYTIGGGAQQHTLYSDPTTTTDGDVDFVMFTVPTTALYTISTGTLRNGPDTYLTLYDTNGTTILATNDNLSGTTYTVAPNDTFTLSSKIVRSLSPGTYYLSVKTSPARPVSAGRYGSYTLEIKSQ